MSESQTPVPIALREALAMTDSVWQAHLKTLRDLALLELPYSENRREASSAFRVLKEAEARPAAVLMVFGFSTEQESREITRLDRASILITRRADHLETHRGQMAFPGGMLEVAAGEKAEEGALREAEEEVALPRQQVQVVGALPSLRTVTRFEVTPVLGLLKSPLESLELRLDAAETAEAFWIPIHRLKAPEVYRVEQVEYRGRHYPTHVYQVGAHRIWGATGELLFQLLRRLERV